MSELKVKFHNITGPVKTMHSVGQPPWFGIGGQYLHYLTEANIPYSRLHDISGVYGCSVYVYIPYIFRDFDADADNSESYDFAFTESLFQTL